MKKIAYVITDLSYGGAQTMLLQLVNNIDMKQFVLEIFVRESKLNTDIEKQFENKQIPCHYLEINDNNYKGLKIVHKIKAFIKFKKAMKKFNPDIVHAHLENFYSALYCIIYNKKYIFTVHSFPNRILTKQFKLLLQILRKKRKLLLVGCANCVSQKMNSLLGKMFSKFIITIYNPINCRKFDIKSKRNGNTFIHVARLESIKNQKLLIDSFEKFALDNLKTKLVIVGDGVLKAELEKYVYEKNLQRSVYFLGNRTDVEKLLANSDYFILTSKSECCPMSILEAMASGIPIISTNVGGIGEIVEDCGVLCEGEKDIVNAMNLLYNNELLRKQLGKKAKKLATKYDAKIITKQYMDIYVI